MASNKTIETTASVSDYINKIKDAQRRKDCEALVDLVKKTTKMEPKMWGTSIVGFGSYHYVYESGREGDAPITGLASRSNAIVLYLSANFDNRDEYLAKLGKHKTGKGCVYIQKLADVDIKILSKMIKESAEYVKKNKSC